MNEPQSEPSSLSLSWSVSKRSMSLMLREEAIQKGGQRPGTDFVKNENNVRRYFLKKWKGVYVWKARAFYF